MKNFILFLLMASPILLSAATVSWDGGAGTNNWTDAMNWDTDALPTMSDDVDIDGSAVVLTASTQVQRVFIHGGGQLTVSSGVTLTIMGTTGNQSGLETNSSGIVENNGTIVVTSDLTGEASDAIESRNLFTNNGTIDINGAGQHGLFQGGGTFTNSTGAIITVDNNGQISTTSGGDPDGDGINVDDGSGSGGMFINNGSITITTNATGDDGIYVNDGSTFNNFNEVIISGTGDNGIRLDDNGVFDNKTGATFSIDGGSDDQILVDNTGAEFVNDGTVTLTNCDSGDASLYVIDSGTFTNSMNGMVDISSSNNYGIQIDANTSGSAEIVNNGMMTLTGGSNDGVRIQEVGLFTNNGTLTINTAGDEGIQIDDATNVSTFDNFGIVNITSSTGHAIEIWGTFNNKTGSTFTADMAGDDGMRLRGDGAVNNDGAINIDNSNDDDIETEDNTFTNTANATFAPGSSPGDFKVEDNFDLGASTITFEIDGTTPITGYDQILNKNSANSITITNAKAVLVWGFTPEVDDCFKIIDESGSVIGNFASVTGTSPTVSVDFSVDYTSNAAEVTICVDAVGPLPVELIHFTGEKTDRGSELSWATASEENNAYFDVEHSIDGRDFSALEKVNGSGTSFTTNNYEYLHRNPASNDNYYRLKQVDFNGNFEYSNIVYLQNKTSDNPTTIYPNPAQNVLTYEGAAATLTFYDIYGRKVMQQNTIEEKANLDISNLGSGAYMIEILSSSNERTFKRFIKK